MSWFPVAEMFIALGIFGFIYWLMNGIVQEMIFISATGVFYDFMLFCWRALPVIVLILAGYYLLSSMQKKQYQEV